MVASLCPIFNSTTGLQTLLKIYTGLNPLMYLGLSWMGDTVMSPILSVSFTDWPDNRYSLSPLSLPAALWLLPRSRYGFILENSLFTPSQL